MRNDVSISERKRIIIKRGIRSCMRAKTKKVDKV
jgi:hypothetical protein